MNKYTFGKCKRCNKIDALENGICKECKKKEEFWDFFSDILKDNKNGI